MTTTAGGERRGESREREREKKAWPAGWRGSGVVPC